MIYSDYEVASGIELAHDKANKLKREIESINETLKGVSQERYDSDTKLSERLDGIEKRLEALEAEYLRRVK